VAWKAGNLQATFRFLFVRMPLREIGASLAIKVDLGEEGGLIAQDSIL
jgi:hypothetical protein